MNHNIVELERMSDHLGSVKQVLSVGDVLTRVARLPKDRHDFSQRFLELRYMLQDLKALTKMPECAVRDELIKDITFYLSNGKSFEKAYNDKVTELEIERDKYQKSQEEIGRLKSIIRRKESALAEKTADLERVCKETAMLHDKLENLSLGTRLKAMIK